MATQRQEVEVIPDFLRMDVPSGPIPASPREGNLWGGWPSKDVKPVMLTDAQGRMEKIRTPVMDLEGIITPVEFHYTSQHFGLPEPVPTEKWSLTLDGEVKRPLALNYEELRRFPGHTVRTVMECSGSDAPFFEYFKGEGPRPSRTNEGMTLSTGEWTGVPLAAVLNEAGLTGKAAFVRAEGWDKGLPRNAEADTQPFFYDKGVPIGKALDADTLLAYAHNGQLLEHIHGAPVRLLVPGWSGNWSVKWLQKLEVLDHMPDCWYHYNYYYYGDSPEDPNKELITAIEVRSLVTHPNDAIKTLPRGTHVVRGYAWSGAATITQVEVSVDSGETWCPARLEKPQDRYMWVRWSYLWEAQQPGQYSVMCRATDAAGRVQLKEPKYNFMRKNFSAIVGNDIVIE